MVSHENMKSMGITYSEYSAIDILTGVESGERRADALMETVVLHDKWLRCTSALLFCLGFDIIEQSCEGEKERCDC
jgi:hypothetical protein